MHKAARANQSLPDEPFEEPHRKRTVYAPGAAGHSNMRSTKWRIVGDMKVNIGTRTAAAIRARPEAGKPSVAASTASAGIMVKAAKDTDRGSAGNKVAS